MLTELNLKEAVKLELLDFIAEGLSSYKTVAWTQDLPGALDDAAVTEALNLHKIKNRQWAIFKTSAIKGEGLFEGLDWYELTFTWLWSTMVVHC